MYVCMYVCIERLDMALCSDYIVRQNDNSRETITHECIIDQEWGKNGWILAYFKDQDEVEGKNLL